MFKLTTFSDAGWVWHDDQNVRNESRVKDRDGSTFLKILLIGFAWGRRMNSTSSYEEIFSECESDAYSVNGMYFYMCS